MSRQYPRPFRCVTETQLGIAWIGRVTQSLRHTLRRESGTHHLQITEALLTVCDYTEAGVDAVTQTMHLVGGWSR